MALGGSFDMSRLSGTNKTSRSGSGGALGKTLPSKTSLGKTMSPGRIGGSKPKTSGGGGSGGNRTPSSGGTRSVPVANSGPVQPIVPDISAYLSGDVDYQNQLRNFDKTLADFAANLGTRRTRLTADYGEGKRNMEKQRVDDLSAIKDDFASRGILGSGLYTDKLGQYEGNYADQLANYERQYNQSTGDLDTENTQFTREQDLQKEAARQDAIRRRAQQYGL